MEASVDKSKYVGSSGVPPPDDPMFSGRIVVSAANHVSSGSRLGGRRPTENAADNKEFRDSLKSILVKEGYIAEDEFDGVVERQWKAIKRYENYIYYYRGEVDVNARQCAVCLGYFRKKVATGRPAADDKGACRSATGGNSPNQGRIMPQ